MSNVALYLAVVGGLVPVSGRGVIEPVQRNGADATLEDAPMVLAGTADLILAPYV
ncbi:hypothetical protein GCM10009539_03890 [Cryptosporangium japonicum]|uniref:Uncharacterized protein n=1 Tax=Cryptosporangium japonicum TaxID=80872 RepID=A0ABP3D3W0_9ACTN